MNYYDNNLDFVNEGVGDFFKKHRRKILTATVLALAPLKIKKETL
jgi:hypothetical protein